MIDEIFAIILVIIILFLILLYTVGVGALMLAISEFEDEYDSHDKD